MGKRILVLAPHTDDGELGCGGAMSRFVEERNDVFYAGFARADVAMAEEKLPPEQPEIEMRAAMKVFGIPEKHIRLFDFPCRNFPKHRQEILQAMYDLNRELSPDLVLMPALGDLHQDHGVVAAEGMRIFKRTTVLCYEQPWNTVTLSTEGFVRLEERHVATKIRALECYVSQKSRKFLSADFIRGWARTRGVQAGVEYAECFEVPRLII
ncbi:MAG: PIG-L family deacetylase [Planctomycetes bacterium]|nr:PIG-L family deacetylase [Planctomycetota bacterium]NUQ33788.1 PIG-L family deacetylase [Planctomycetaceae bacterium]